MIRLAYNKLILVAIVTAVYTVGCLTAVEYAEAKTYSRKSRLKRKKPRDKVVLDWEAHLQAAGVHRSPQKKLEERPSHPNELVMDVGLTQYRRNHSSGSIIAGKAVGRVWLSDKTIFDPKNLYLSWSEGSFQALAGYETITWGETFGLPVVDFVNPRDLRDPLWLDDEWTKLSVPLIDLVYSPDPFTLQVLFNPVPRLTRIADSWNGVKLESKDLNHDLSIMEKAEYGGRLGIRVDSFDLNFITYTHWNRNPVFTIKSITPDVTLQTVNKKVTSYGISASYAGDYHVIRLDAAYNQSNLIQKWTTTWQAEEADTFLGVLGFDWTFENQLQLGVQYLESHIVEKPDTKVNAVGLRASMPLFDDVLEPEVIWIRGLNSKDEWLQASLKTYIGYGFRLLLRYDSIEAKPWQDGLYKSELLQGLQDEDRYFVVLHWQY